MNKIKSNKYDAFLTTSEVLMMTRLPIVSIHDKNLSVFDLKQHRTTRQCTIDFSQL